ncbi:MAG: F0F1 ATP synthase subunit alpha [candidate division SR1 bacterium]|nr:F0F1 ATP synthase subunit alpha [candidate division SR1 bacterium]RKW24776.1 MAG: F0F1 ATP synthase subunit alpha [Candidatus Gracilibacteria bacterium]
MSALTLIQKIEQQINEVNLAEAFTEQGTIIDIKDGVATVSGLHNAQYSEIVVFQGGQKGLVLDLMEDYVGVLVLGEYMGLSQGETVKTTGQLFSVGVGDEYIGRVLNALGDPVDGGKELKAQQFFPVEKVAPGVITRKSVDQPLQTGIKAVDALVPIGRGQRELIIGDRQTGKTAVAIDTIINQKGEDVICIYVAIGQKESKVVRIVEALKKAGAMDYTIVINAPINTPAVMQYIAPYVGATFGEYIMSKGKDALIIYDDLTKHAAAYREMSLLLRRPPGREAYPGDVFYLHSRLLERACRLNKDYGGGSLTALPIIETQAGDVAAYIPTNVISITDGQIYLESDLFNAGIKPAINVGLSVSRVGGSAQTGIMKKVAGTLKLELAAFRELETFAKFGSDLDKSTQAKLARGQRLVEMLKQKENSPLPFYKQAVLLYAGIKGYLDGLALNQISTFEAMLYDKLETTHKGLVEQILKEKKLTEAIEQQMKTLIEETSDEIAAKKK